MCRALDAALLLDKAIGLSSNAALQQARRLLRAQKAGHAGTLDPLASGLLLVLFGEATKFAGPLLDSDKEYVATLHLGMTTSTGDAEGAVIDRRAVDVGDEAIEQTLRLFRGRIAQVPPMHSALKQGGVPLYQLARRGETVQRRPREVHIRELETLGRKAESIMLRVRCSKGTYIRTLAEDIGKALGTGAHLSALRRTALGPFRAEDAIGLETLGALDETDRDRRLLPLQSLFAGMARAEIDPASECRFRQGQALKQSGLPEGLCAVYGHDGAVIGLGVSSGGQLKPVRLTAMPMQEADNP
jgi:tRNA pseudouridine55 synthase